MKMMIKNGRLRRINDDLNLKRGFNKEDWSCIYRLKRQWWLNCTIINLIMILYTRQGSHNIERIKISLILSKVIKNK
jgi:hypothetical protein